MLSYAKRSVYIIQSIPNFNSLLQIKKGRQVIDDKFIEDLKDRLSIVDVVDSYIKLTKAGKNFEACCPFHEEKTPSFVVHPDTQNYHCYGSCGGGDIGHGNVIDFVMNYEKLSFPEAVKKLAHTAGMDVVYLPNNDNGQKFKANPKITTLKSALNAASSVYAGELANSKEAIVYMKSRGIIGGDVRDFILGYAPKGFATIKNALHGQFSTEILKEASLLKEDEEHKRTYDFFNNRIMFPVRNEKGDVIAFGGRRFDGVDKNKYINSASTEVFDKSSTLYGLYESLNTPGQKIERGVYNIVEGYLDVISAHRIGHTNTLATMGTALCESHVRKMYQRGNKIRLIRDGDKAGIKAIVKDLIVIAPFLSAKNSVTICLLTNGEDPCSLITSPNGEALFDQLIKSEMPASKYLIDYLFSNNSDDAEGKTKALTFANDFIDRLTDEDLKLVFRAELNNRLGVSTAKEKSSEELLQSVPQQMITLLSSIEGSAKALAGLYLIEPKWTKMLPANSELKKLFNKSAIDLINFSLHKPDNPTAQSICNYLVSCAPKNTGDQIDLLFNLKLEINKANKMSGQPNEKSHMSNS